MTAADVEMWRARVEDAQREAWAAWTCPVTSTSGAAAAADELLRVIADARAAGALDRLGRWADVEQES